jgi:hypothetical protein
MILRRLTKHVKEQNWFAVGLDFVIVVLGILIAFQITNWSAARKARADLVLAEQALTADLIQNYFHAQERVTLNRCRIESLRTLAERLMAPGDKWEGGSRGELDIDVGFAIDPVLRSPSRIWGSSTWAAELARGTFNSMPQDRRAKLDTIFKATSGAQALQDSIIAGQARLKVLGRSMELSRSDRLRYFDIVAEVDESSHYLEYTSGIIATSIEELDIVIQPDHPFLSRDRIAEMNTFRAETYGSCVKPFELPFYADDPSTPEKAHQP